MTLDDRALFVYTSGTTGLPKAAIVSHFRLMNWAHWFAGMMDTRPDDRMYNCLPMYHSVGGAVATGAVLVNGGSVVIRDGFSADAFWDDIRRHGCTIFQYIGELCRYLLNATPPPAERDRAAALLRQRAAGGHLDGVQGALPHSADPRVLCLDRRQHHSVQCRGTARCDRPDTVVHRPSLAARARQIRCRSRRSAARCRRALYCGRTNEGGEAIGRIGDAAGEPGGRFDGYTAADETEKKFCTTCSRRADAACGAPIKAAASASAANVGLMVWFSRLRSQISVRLECSFLVTPDERGPPRRSWRPRVTWLRYRVWRGRCRGNTDSGSSSRRCRRWSSDTAASS